MNTPQPKFKHDCISCIFLGTIVINDKHGDVYVCKSKRMKCQDNILVRFSDEYSDYSATFPTVHMLNPFTMAAVSMWANHYEVTGSSISGQLTFKDNSNVKI